MHWERRAFEIWGHEEKHRPLCTGILIKTIVKTDEISEFGDEGYIAE